MTTATPPKSTTTKKPPAVCEVRYDSRGVSISLPKASSVALVRCRDVCAGLAAAAPTVSAQANGIRKALDSLIAAIASGPKVIEVDLDEQLKDEPLT